LLSSEGRTSFGYQRDLIRRDFFSFFVGEMVMFLYTEAL